MKIKRNQTEKIDKETINKITELAKIRERAFFTIMRQSGLTPLSIKKLKVKDIEVEVYPIEIKVCPCKIHTTQEQRRGKFGKYPVFIGKEAINYLNQYIKTRKKLTSDSLLFATHTNPEKEINTKDVSRTFKEIIKQKLNTLSKEKLSEPKLFDLITFYRENTKDYYKQLRNQNSENEELCRRFYEERAMPYLEIEQPITIEIKSNKKRLQKEINELTTRNRTMTQTIAKDSKFISEILTLIYNNNGDTETGENEKIGDDFIELWKELQNKQYNLPTYVGFDMPFEWLDIVDELTKKLKKIKKPYDVFETKYGIDLSRPFNKLEPSEAKRIDKELSKVCHVVRNI